MRVDVPLTLAVPISLAVAVLPILIFGRQREDKDQTATSTSVGRGPDLLLFLVSFTMHAFMVTFPFRALKPTPSGLHALVCFTAAAHLVAQYVCCFGVEPKEKSA